MSHNCIPSFINRRIPNVIPTAPVNCQLQYNNTALRGGNTSDKYGLLDYNPKYKTDTRFSMDYHVPQLRKHVLRNNEYCKDYIQREHLLRKPTLKKIFTPKGTGLMEFCKPAGIAFFPYSDIAVADLNNNRVQMLNKNWDLVRSVRHEGRSVRPHGLAVVPHSDHLACTDQLERCVKIFNPITSELVSQFGHGITGCPSGLAINSKGQYIVSDVEKHCVHVFESNGRHCGSFGGPGNSDDKFQYPFWLCIGNRDTIIVSDSWNNRIKVFDPVSFRFICKYGRWGEGELHAPKGVCVDMEGNVLVCDSGNHRVTRFNQNGVFMQHVLKVEDGIRAPYGITVGETGEMVISGLLDGELRVYDNYNTK